MERQHAGGHEGKGPGSCPHGSGNSLEGSTDHASTFAQLGAIIEHDGGNFRRRHGVTGTPVVCLVN
jgi:hypothetical protein